MRLDYGRNLPGALQPVREVDGIVEASALDPRVVERIRLRGSQIDGRAYRLDLHTNDPDAMGEDAQRLHLVAVWRWAPVVTSRQRAAPAWTEAHTLLSETGAPDHVDAEVARQHGSEEQVALTLAIVAISSWNRLLVGFRQPVGSYVSPLQPSPA
jgi:AhpD family alkylhydroperoxidase